ncbi:MAG TPA: hypothetical protein V6D06_11995 [Trichocoleus sp.]
MPLKRRRQRSGALPVPVWGVGLASLLLSLVNGPLVISCGVGLVAYQQLKRLTPEQWQQLSEWVQRQQIAPSARTKTLLLSGSALAATYVTTALWAETHQLAVAIALGRQSLLTLALLGWLLRGAPTPPGQAPETAERPEPENSNREPVRETVNLADIDDLLEDLAHPDPLRRLVRVRQLTRVALGNTEQSYLEQGTVSVRSHLVDCFHLMLAQEQEPLVREALREGLHCLRPPAQLPEGGPPLPTSKEMKQTSRVRRSVVEYIEP